MLLLEEAIERVITQEGQNLIPLAAFSLDKLRIQNLFKTSLMEYQEYFPNIKTKKIAGTGTCLQIKDCIGSPLSLRFGGFPNVVGMNARYDKPNWQWNYQTKTITTVLGGGPWIITYAAEYNLDYQDVTESYRVIKGEDEIELNLRAEFKGKSLVVKRKTDGLSMKVVDTYEKDGLSYAELEGPLGTGTVLINDLRLKLELDSTRDDELQISYITKYLGIKELDFQNMEFITWFGSKLLTAIGSLKLMTQLEGIPFQISTDDLLARGRELQQQVESDLKVQKQDFYKWTGNHY